MADNRVIYPVDNYIGSMLAEAVGKYNEARNKLKQVAGVLETITDNVELETAMGMAHDLSYGETVRTSIVGVVTAIDNWAYAMSRMDKGL